MATSGQRVWRLGKALILVGVGAVYGAGIPKSDDYVSITLPPGEVYQNTAVEAKLIKENGGFLWPVKFLTSRFSQESYDVYSNGKKQSIENFVEDMIRERERSTPRPIPAAGISSIDYARMVEQWETDRNKAKTTIETIIKNTK